MIDLISLTSFVDAGAISGSFISFFIALAIPLILVAFGGMFSEHSGIINIALEGIMVIGAMVGALIMSSLDGAVVSGGLDKTLATIVAFLGAALSGAIFSLLLSLASNRFKADQTIAGTALNIMAPAIFIIIVWAIQGQGKTQILIPSWKSYTPADFGIADGSMPTFISTLLFSALNKLGTAVAIIVIPFSAILLYKTKFGLRLRACGENPQAAESLGIRVLLTRYIGVGISGSLAGIGGLAYALIVSSSFNGNVAGYGFLAIAVMIFGAWKPGRIIFAALFFSFFMTLSNQAQTLHEWLTWLPTFENVKNGGNIYLLLPYVVTLIVLIFSSKKSQAPKAEGVPFDVSKRS